MCGRFSEIEPGDVIKRRFNVEFKGAPWHPRYNIAPSEHVPVILNSDPKLLEYVRWGIVPRWAQGTSKELINARSESLLTKPTFKQSFLVRRCLIIADGFYEWKREGTRKVPFRITLSDQGLFAFAGIWESQTDKKGDADKSCAIITVEPNEMMAEIHNRMPAILSKEHERLWLSSRISPMNLMKLLLPYPQSRMRAFAISTLVNSPRNDVPAVIQPV